MKDNFFVGASVMNHSAKFKLNRAHNVRGIDFLIFAANFAFQLPRQPSKFRGLGTNDMLGQGLLKQDF